MWILPPKPPKQEAPKKRKMTKQEEADAFEKWMLDQWYWSRIDGQLYMSGSHISLKDAEKQFKAFISKPI